MMDINSWKRLWSALDYYHDNGFFYIDVPWIVPEKAVAVTLPSDRTGFSINKSAEPKFLVGSAEQSFIHLMQENKLSIGNYVACSPCFRDDERDATHQLHFMKVELIEFFEHPKKVALARVFYLADIAFDFFESMIADHHKLRIVETDIGFDIELNDIEIGSYGYRTFNNYHWVYGTGIAEPRFSYAMESLK